MKSPNDTIEALATANLGHTAEGRRISMELVFFASGVLQALQDITANPSLSLGAATVQSDSSRAGFDAVFKLYRELKA